MPLENRPTRWPLFELHRPESAATWCSINDEVMGGASTSRLSATLNGTVVFSGTLSLANRGGFASVRSRVGSTDFSAFAGLSLTFCGDGQRYKISLQTDDPSGVSYQAAFDTSAGHWQSVDLRFCEFQPVFRGRTVTAARSLDTVRIRSVGLLISDGQVGPFRLELSRIDLVCGRDFATGATRAL